MTEGYIIFDLYVEMQHIYLFIYLFITKPADLL